MPGYSPCPPLLDPIAFVIIMWAGAVNLSLRRLFEAWGYLVPVKQLKRLGLASSDDDDDDDDDHDDESDCEMA